MHEYLGKRVLVTLGDNATTLPNVRRWLGAKVGLSL